MMVHVRSSSISMERLGTRRGITKKRLLPRVLTLSLFRLAMIIGSKVIRGTDAQRKSSKRKLNKFVAKLMLLRMLSRRVRMWLMTATMGLETVNQMPWTEIEQLMIAEFCPVEEIQRMEHELWNLRVKEYNIVAYTQRFNKLALMYSRMVEPESAKIEAYI
nr:hypothetical protein [Tanacetum cinerariifolium]